MHTTTDPAASLDPVPLVPPRVAAWFAAAAALSFASSILFRTITIPHWSLKLLLAMLPVPALAGLLLAAFRVARGTDELERKVQLEALACSFAFAGLAFLVFNQLQIGGMLGPEDWFMPWVVTWLAYTLGLAAARKRYT